MNWRIKMEFLNPKFFTGNFLLVIELMVYKRLYPLCHWEVVGNISLLGNNKSIQYRTYKFCYLLLNENLSFGGKTADLTFSKKHSLRGFWCNGLKTTVSQRCNPYALRWSTFVVAQTSVPDNVMKMSHRIDVK